MTLDSIESPVFGFFEWPELMAILVLWPLLMGLLLLFTRWKRKNIAAWLATYSADEPLQTWETDQEWRTPTGLRLVDRLTDELTSIEKHLVEGREEASVFQRRTADLSKTTPITWLELHTPCPDPEVISRQGRKLCEKLDRIWAGDIYSETEDRKDQLERLQWALGEIPHEKKTKSRLDLKEKILAAERDIRDLEVIKLRVEARVAISTDQAAFRKSQEKDELDVQDAGSGRFIESRKQVAIRLQEKVQIEKVEATEGLTDEVKEQLISEIKKAADAAFSQALEKTKPGSFYKEE